MLPFRIALVTPRHSFVYKYEEICNSLGHFENLATEYLGAVLENDGFEVDFYNYQLDSLSRREVITALRERDYRLVGFSVNSANTREALAICQFIPARTHCSFGGYSASLFPNALLSEARVDSVILGEGESAFLELAQRLRDGRDWSFIAGLCSQTRRNPPRPLADLRDLPVPSRRELTDYFTRGQLGRRHRRVALVSASRGCFGKCSFCYVAEFYRLAPGPCIRYRSPADVVDEIETLVRGPLKIEYIWFVDEEFVGRRPDRCREFIARMRERGLSVPFEFDCRTDSVDADLFAELKSVGLAKVFLGAESFSQSFLDRIHKRTTVETNLNAISILQSLEIDYRLGMIFFDSETTTDELRETVTWCDALDFGRVNDPGRALKRYTIDGLEWNMPSRPEVRSVFEALHAEIDRQFGSAGAIDMAALLQKKRQIGQYFLGLINC